MMTASSGREQVQGMAGLHGSKAGRKTKTPQGFKIATPLFNDIARHFSGTWFEDIESQDDLHRRAVRWDRRLSRYSQRVVEDVMAEIVGRGDYKAPTLDTVAYLCQRISDENESHCGFSSQSSRAARDKMRAEVKSMGVIRG